MAQNMHSYEDDNSNDDKDGSYGNKIKGDDEDETRGEASEPVKVKGSEGSRRMSPAVMWRQHLGQVVLNHQVVELNEC